MSFKSEEIVEFVQQHFKSVADPEKAKQMAAYMKTDMPFYGVQKPLRRPLNRAIKRRFPASSQQAYKRTVMLLWRLPHREEKYTAIEYARINPQFIEPKSLPLYEQLIREGAWWDLVDSVASDLVGLVLLNFRSTTRQLMETWIEDSDLWIRRTAILSQLRHKQQTDVNQLFDFCLRRAPETEFFIRKAIGWALREYSKAAPKKVKEFLTQNRQVLSGLSYREGAKWLVRTGIL